MKYIVSVSGGLGSAEALKRTIETYGKDNVIAVFADVKGDGSMPWLGMPTITTLLNERFGGESRDTYRFIWQLSHALDIDIIRLEGTKTIWDAFIDAKAITPMTGVCPASEQLKRERIAQWIEQQGYQPGQYAMVLGMGWDEEHRTKSSAAYWFKRMGWPVPVIAPNAKQAFYAYIPSSGRAIFTTYPTDFKYMYATKEVTALWCTELGCEIASAYKDGMDHDNCGKKCVLAGLSQYAIVYDIDREGYLWVAWMEWNVQRYLGKPYTILRNQRKDSAVVALSLYLFADSDTVEAQLMNRPNIHLGNFNKMATGACTCFTDIDLLRDYVYRAPEPAKQMAMAI